MRLDAFVLIERSGNFSNENCVTTRNSVRVLASRINIFLVAASTHQAMTRNIV